jgi:DNA polymerase IV
MGLRKIIHIDMDAFFASVEEREHPEYKGKPLGVGGKSRRSVLTTANYEARKFGVHSAMPTSVAFRKCPQLILVECNFELYRKISAQIREIFKEYTDMVEPLSLDEAFLDVTKNKKNIELAVDIAKEIKVKIKAKTGLTASAGVSSNKFVAKLASDFRKPDGLTVIHPSVAEEFIGKLSIEKFFGVGKVTAAKMHKIGIKKGTDLKKLSEEELISKFGKSGSYYYNIVRNIDNRPVEPSRKRKSFSLERTYEFDLVTKEQIKSKLDFLIDKLSELIKKHNVSGCTITLKVKYADFKQITRSKTTEEVIDSKEVIAKSGYDLMKKVELDKKGPNSNTEAPFSGIIES